MRALKFFLFGKAETYSVLGRGFAALSGLVISLFVLENLSAEEQGFLYLMLSMKTFTLLTELGFYNVLITYLSSFQDIHKNIDIKIINIHNWKFWALLSRARKWYFIISSAFLVLALIWGGVSLLILDYKPRLLTPWIVASVSLTVALYLNHVLAAVEALGDVPFVYVCRFQSTFYSLILGIMVISTSHPMWAPAVIFLSTSAILYFKIYTKYQHLLILKYKFTLTASQSQILLLTLKRMFHMQWKMALSTISGFLAFSSIVPITFALKGSVDAGKMGISVSFVTAILSIGTALTSPKVALMADLNSRKELSKSIGVMKKTCLLIFLCSSVLSLMLILGLVFLENNDIPYINRMVGIGPLSLLLLSGIASAASLPLGYWLRSFGEEPLLILSLVTGLVTFLGLCIGNMWGSIDLVIGIYSSVTLISVVAVIFKFKSKIG